MIFCLLETTFMATVLVQVVVLPVGNVTHITIACFGIPGSINWSRRDQDHDGSKSCNDRRLRRFRRHRGCRCHGRRCRHRRRMWRRRLVTRLNWTSPG